MGKFSNLLHKMLDGLCPSGWYKQRLVNQSATFVSDIGNYIQDEVLDLSYRALVAYQFGKPLRLPENRARPTPRAGTCA